MKPRLDYPIIESQIILFFVVWLSSLGMTPKLRLNDLDF